jgi:hypothetical protein
MALNEGIKSHGKKLQGCEGGIGLAVFLADVSVTETYRRVRYGHNGRSAAVCAQRHTNNLVQSLNIKMVPKFARIFHFEDSQIMRGTVLEVSTPPCHVLLLVSSLSRLVQKFSNISIFRR